MGTAAGVGAVAHATGELAGQPWIGPSRPAHRDHVANAGGDHSEPDQYGGRHAIAETELNEDFFRRNVLGARGYVDISFLKDFKFTFNAGADITNQNDVTYGNPLVGDGSPAGRATHRFDNISNFNFNQLLNYSKSFGSHNVSALVGHENWNRRENFVTASRSQLSLDGNIELRNFATVTNGDSFSDKYKVEGYFSRVNYDFNEK